MMMVFLNSGQEKHIIKIVEVVTIIGFCCIDSRASHPQQLASVKPAYKLGKCNVLDKTYTQAPVGKQGALRPCAEFWRSTGAAPRLLFPQVLLLANISPKKENTGA